MAANDPTWSYGKSKLFSSSGATITDGDDVWSYGKDVVYHEYITPAVGGIMPQLQKNNLGNDLFNGTLL